MAKSATADDPLDSSDPYARPEQTFPVLTGEMAARVARFGRRETLADGYYIFRRGERAVAAVGAAVLGLYRSQVAYYEGQ